MISIVNWKHTELALAVVAGLGLIAVFHTSDSAETAFLIAAIPLGLALAWIWPVGAAFCFIALSCFRIHEAYPVLMPFSLPLAFSILLIVGSFLHIAGRNLTTFIRPELTFLLLFALHVTIGLVLSYDRDLSYKIWSESFIKTILVAIMMAWIVKFPRDCAVVTATTVLSGVAISLVAIYNSLNGIDLVEGNRVAIGIALGSQIGDPNDLAFVLMFAVAFALCGLLARDALVFERLMFGAALALIIWAIVATKSRGGQIGTMAVFAYFFAKRYKSATMPIIACGIVGCLIYVLSGVGNREYGDLDADGLDESSASRINAWKAGIGMALSRPVFGMGLGNFGEGYYLFAPIWDGKNRAAHSIWFQVLGETGFVGLVLYVGMVYFTFRAIVGLVRNVDLHIQDERIRGLALALAAGFTGTCAAGTFLSQAYSWPVFIQVALISALAHHVNSIAVQRKNEATMKSHPFGLPLLRGDPPTTGFRP